MKKIQIALITASIFLLQNSFVFADGGSNDPYYHPPVDTGLVTDPIYFLGIVLLFAGFILLLNAKSILSKLETK